MSSASWNPDWVHEFTADLRMPAFRMVETQYVAATMRLVDSADEQQMLEEMLENSKPPLPPQASGLHYLLAAPFRYVPQTGSAFALSIRRAFGTGLMMHIAPVQKLPIGVSAFYWTAWDS